MGYGSKLPALGNQNGFKPFEDSVGNNTSQPASSQMGLDFQNEHKWDKEPQAVKINDHSIKGTGNLLPGLGGSNANKAFQGSDQLFDQNASPPNQSPGKDLSQNRLFGDTHKREKSR